MGGSYWTLASDELMGSEPAWPAGLRPAARGPEHRPGMRWWLFQDDTAEGGGEPGQAYELVFTATPDGSFTWTRHLVAGLTAPCCDMHNEHCEPPGDLCCGLCTEARHGGWTDTNKVRRWGHPHGEACVLPDLPLPVLPG